MTYHEFKGPWIEYKDKKYPLDQDIFGLEVDKSMVFKIHQEGQSNFTLNVEGGGKIKGNINFRVEVGTHTKLYLNDINLDDYFSNSE
jgi:hypothetical protein|tara:strand:- start:226 stop:486 length:261 start_codon:yes stop_codon:yes gene_type:complete